MGVAQNQTAGVTQVLLFGSIYQGAISAHFSFRHRQRSTHPSSNAIRRSEVATQRTVKLGLEESSVSYDVRFGLFCFLFVFPFGGDLNLFCLLFCSLFCTLSFLFVGGGGEGISHFLSGPQKV